MSENDIDEKINSLWNCNLCNELVGDGYNMLNHFLKKHPREWALMETRLKNG